MPEGKDIYFPILVGAYKNYKKEITYQRDDIGDNISKKNSSYNELTAIYWAWKNLDADIVGLVHYRRYFFKNVVNKDLKNVIDKNDIEALLSKHDVILPRKRNYIIETNYSHYIHAHHKEPIDETRKIIARYYPEYLSSFDKVMSRRKAHMFNMFIMKRNLFDNYSKWLMGVLDKLEDKIDISNYSVQESRVFGYVSEVLMDVWIETNGVNYVEVPWKQIGKVRLFSKVFNFLKRKFLPNSKSRTHF
ncbi:lipopolysaccharide biosynthesis glycosyltransferase [Companilactobacillus paralimentarius DSM 13238 = JCM 10415]|uniref:Lipopolysaccharide biosynthesis glycosyltransferase n=2 Tax=Companilactobacillus paralimentarius TaxID=83526 RepID=A0A0R1PR98_9LACO|nr:lipopolysaccharide biosynthesis glycosyltransferase [Companilactobacillus paralimentarius DSM 13238 = JCM 10415]